VILSARLDPGSETFAAELYAALGACYEAVPGEYIPILK
jgi:hypothetical protein